MPPNMRFSTSTIGETATLAEVCKLAWHTFYGMQKASEDFENLRFEVWTIAISLDSLHSVGTTSTLIDRQPDRARWALTFSKILTSLSSALRPLHSMVKLYLSSTAKDRGRIKNWLTHPDLTYEGLTIQDFRRKLSMLVESLNVFLSCLTHAELARAKDVSESEEYRVLSEVTQTVLHKWDQDVASGIRRPKDRVAQPIEPPGYVNDDVKQYMMPLLNNNTHGLGLHVTNMRSPPILQQRPSSEQVSRHPGGTMNLEDIEQGFRSHMHAMRRIREQLRQQKVNDQHLSAQTSTNFPEVSSNTISHHFGVHPPPTPTTPTLQRHATESTQTSDSTGDYADASSSCTMGSLQSSEASSVISNYRGLQTKAMLTPRQEITPGPERKRKRRPQYRFKTGMEEASSPPSEGSSRHSQSGSGSDDGQGPPRRKTPLETLLTTLLFFDQ